MLHKGPFTTKLPEKAKNYFSPVLIVKCPYYSVALLNYESL